MVAEYPMPDAERNPQREYPARSYTRFRGKPLFFPYL
jgi:hypothetical protein